MSQQTLHDPRATSQEGDPAHRADELRLVRFRLRLVVVGTAIISVAVYSALAILFGAGPGRFASTTLGIVPVPPIVLLVVVVAASGWLMLRIGRTVLQAADGSGEAQRRAGNDEEQDRPDALVDPLTGLGNHRAFQEEFDRQLQAVRGSGHAVSLLLIDLDDFRTINDTAGHAVGDVVLREIAKLLRSGLRRSDRAYRVGGDEFAVLMAGTQAEEAQTVTRRILSACLEPRREAGFERGLSFSAGIASAPVMGVTRAELFARADDALYRAKREGRTTICVFDPENDARPLTGDRLARAANAVVDVVSSTAVSPVYQPIVDLRTGTVVGFEGLSRPDPQTAFGDATSMFSVAEASGRTADLDWLCARAILSGVSGRLAPDQMLSLNISPMTIEAPEFQPQVLLGLLKLAGLTPDRLVIEITERQAIEQLQTVRSKLDVCRAAGVRIAIDDVGAGSSSMRLFSQIDFDIVKLDLVLAEAGGKQEAARDILRTLLELSSRRGAAVIAEGVETVDQLRMVRDIGLEQAQGFVLGHPTGEPTLRSVDVEAILGEQGSSAILRALATSAT